MPRTCIAVALLLWPTIAHAKLEIKNVQPSHGLLGPARAGDDVYPLDEYFVRYQVTGIKPNSDGKAELEIHAKLVGPDASQNRVSPDCRPRSEPAIILVFAFAGRTTLPLCAQSRPAA